jgi:hypothetical protein
VLIAGGFDSSLNHLTSAELYSPASGTVTREHEDVPREFHGNAAE